VPRSRASLYYYANGVKVPLTLDPTLVAVRVEPSRGGTDTRGADDDRHSPQPSSPPLGRSLGQGYVLLAVDPASPPTPSSTDDEARSEIRQAVVRSSDDTIIVPLPEVRVAGDDATIDNIRRWLERSGEASLDDDVGRHGQLTIRPDDNSGLSAIRLANDIHERFHPTLAQPRFIRITTNH
jgi:hypothetical protein